MVRIALSAEVNPEVNPEVNYIARDAHSLNNRIKRGER
jgi:hypothetical protein